MAQTKLSITVRQRWWVRPYMAAVCAFLWSVAWAVDEDDDRIDGLIERQAKFVAAHGFALVPTSQDPETA